MSLKALTPTQTAVECHHCGTAFAPSEREAEFCCSGCRFVFHLLHKRGLEDFYKFGDRKAPVGTGVFHDRNLEWLEALQAEAEEKSGAPTAELLLSVQGISCAGCVWLLEAVFQEHPGAVSAVVNSSAGTIRLRWKKGACSLAGYAGDAARFGYLFGKVDGPRTPTTKPLVRKLGLCAALAMNAMLFALPRYLGMQPGEEFAKLFEFLAFGIATASLLIGGSYFFRRAMAALRHRELHIDLPISLGLLVAYAGSVVGWQTGRDSFAYFDFVSIFTFLMLLGRWLQERAVESNRSRLLSARLAPGEVTVLRNGLETKLTAESLEKGLRFKIPGGGIVPVRAKLLSPPNSFALNWINGEPAPRQFSKGSLVPSGARSLAREPLEFLALEAWSESQLAQLLSLGDGGRWRNAGLQAVMRTYLTLVILVAAGGFLFWGFAAGSWVTALQVLVSVLVVSCPCAIGVALPLLDDLAASRLQERGVYIRETSLWQRLQQVQRLLLDKTGTLTLENLLPADPSAILRLSPHEKSVLLRMAGESLHPVATSLREVLLASGVEPAPGDSEVREIPGMGLEWESPEGTWRLGRSSWASNRPGSTCLALEKIPIADFTFREELRPSAKNLIRSLQNTGLGITLLSGDDPARVRSLAEGLGLNPGDAIGGLTPAEKAAFVRENWPGRAMMVGDGANDSLAFDAALCRGTPAADSGLLEHKSDFYLIGRSLSGLQDLFAMGSVHRRAARSVFSFAITYNAAAVGFSLAGLMNPLVAAVIMPLSSLASIALVFAHLNPTKKST